MVGYQIKAVGFASCSIVKHSITGSDPPYFAFLTSYSKQRLSAPILNNLISSLSFSSIEDPKVSPVISISCERIFPLKTHSAASFERSFLKSETANWSSEVAKYWPSGLTMRCLTDGFLSYETFSSYVIFLYLHVSESRT